jgi:hypothetical protein
MVEVDDPESGSSDASMEEPETVKKSKKKKSKRMKKSKKKKSKKSKKKSERAKSLKAAEDSDEDSDDDQSIVSQHEVASAEENEEGLKEEEEQHEEEEDLSAVHPRIIPRAKHRIMRTMNLMDNLLLADNEMAQHTDEEDGSNQGDDQLSVLSNIHPQDERPGHGKSQYSNTR